MIISRVVETEDAFSDLREQWDDVLRRSSSNEFFLTWEWLFAWWKSFKEDSDRLCIILLAEEGILAGIAPLMISETNYYGFRLRKLCFIGEGASDRSDVFVVRNDPAIFSELVKCIYNKIEGWDLIYLREIPENSLFLEYMKGHFEHLDVEEDSKCPYIEFNTGTNWESFYKSLSKKIKRDFANKINRMAKLGSYSFEHIRDKKTVSDYIDTIKRIELNSLKADTNISLCFDSEEKVNFQKRIVDGAGQGYEVLVSFLKLNGQTIAHLYGFIYNNVYHTYNMAFLPEYVRVSPGKLLMNETVRWVIENKYKKFDFLRGDSYIKSKWSQDSRNQIRLTVFSKSLKHSIIRLLVFKIRPALKKMINKSHLSGTDNSIGENA